MSIDSPVPRGVYRESLEEDRNSTNCRGKMSLRGMMTTAAKGKALSRRAVYYLLLRGEKFCPALLLEALSTLASQTRRERRLG